MDLVGLLKELRLLKGQAGYRYCLAWLVVVGHVATRRPVVFLIVIWSLAQLDGVKNMAKTLTFLVPIVLRAINKLIQLG